MICVHDYMYNYITDNKDSEGKTPADASPPIGIVVHDVWLLPILLLLLIIIIMIIATNTIVVIIGARRVRASRRGRLGGLHWGLDLNKHLIFWVSKRFTCSCKMYVYVYIYIYIYMHINNYRQVGLHRNSFVSSLRPGLTLTQLAANESIIDLRTEESFANMYLNFKGTSYIGLSTTNNIIIV